MTDALPPSPDAREAAKKLWLDMTETENVLDRSDGEIERWIAERLTAFAARPGRAPSTGELSVVAAAIKTQDAAQMVHGRWTIPHAQMIRFTDALNYYRYPDRRNVTMVSRASSAAPSASAARQTDATPDELDAYRQRESARPRRASGTGA